jgi:hypothetical protein
MADLWLSSAIISCLIYAIIKEIGGGFGLLGLGFGGGRDPEIGFGWIFGLSVA